MKEMVSVDLEAGGVGVLVVIDVKSVIEAKYVLVIEAKRFNLPIAMKQFLLSLKDMKDLGGQGTIYGVHGNGRLLANV